MNLTLLTFPALYGATILMLIGTGLFFSFIGLRLTGEGVSELWIGALTAAYYAGMVCGAKFGHRMIASVGHVRSYVACAGVATIISPCCMSCSKRWSSGWSCALSPVW